MGTMTKSELIEAISAATGSTKKQAGEFLTALNSVATDALANGDDVILGEIGKLKPTERAARTGHNPKTGEAIQIAAKRGVKFAASKALTDRLN